MTDERPSPDALLSALPREQAARRRGRLKVFLGMCPGVGKTCAMLEAAQRQWRAGRRVVVGYVETHGRRETEALTTGLPRIPRRRVDYRGVVLQEMDLDALLAQKPELALVDELAHTNAPDSRHPKRWQDVAELLDAGIDVFTTLNVQHVESRADTVRQVTDTEVRETVPDRVLDEAVLELVDLPPTELIQRLRDGRVYVPDRAATAAEHFFRESNLTALRELSLRLVADHVGEDTLHWRRTRSGAGAWKTAHRLLVAVGPSPASAALIRWTRQMADALQCRWTAVYVEGSRALAEPAQAQLTRNLATARELGAEVITTSAADLIAGLLRVAREQNATQIVIGKPGDVGWLPGLKNARWLRRLARESGDIDLHVVRAEKAAGSPSQFVRAPLESNLHHYLTAIGVVAGTAVLNLLLQALAGPRVPGLVFLLAVVLLALFTGRGPVLLAGALSALGWNFFFLPPRFTFAIERAEDALLFLAYFVVAVVLGQLVARIREQAQAEQKREQRATALYELMRNLAEAGSPDEVVWHLAAQVLRVFDAPSAVSLNQGGKLATHPDSVLALPDKELSVAQWAFDQGKAAGRSTDTLPGAAALHLPLATSRAQLGVLSVSLPDHGLAPAQRDLLESFVAQAALVLDRMELRTSAAHASLLAESERLGRVLLNSISHELRTPLAASTSAATALAEAHSPELRRALIDELQEANARLDRIVGNLLDVARLEADKVHPHWDWYEAGDLVRGVVQQLQRELRGRPFTLDLPDAPALVRVDGALLEHALANLLLNAVAHTPPGSPIEMQVLLRRPTSGTAGVAGRPGQLLLRVADRGPGLSAELLPRIFDKFVRGPGAKAGGSGLGLTITRGFVEAHGGTIAAANRPDGGAVFTLTLPQDDPAPKLEPSP